MENQQGAKILKGHTLSGYDSELAEIRSSIKEMRKLLVDILGLFNSALSGEEDNFVEQSQAADKRINELDANINSIAANILALRQPVAIDLRFVISAIKITTILERVGDKAKNCIKRVSQANEAEIPDAVKEKLLEMVEITKKMIKASAKGFGNIDSERAEKVWNKETELDDLAHDVFDLLQSHMEKNKDFINHGMKLLLIMKDIERIGDYATNITRIVEYVSYGDRKGLGNSGEEG